MGDAIRQLTIRKGIDPREFILVAFGGAGPMHAAFIAEELGISKVIIPRAAGVFSAWGMQHTDVRYDTVRTLNTIVEDLSKELLQNVFQELEIEAQSTIVEQGIETDISFRRQMDLRYLGQEFTLPVSIPEEKSLDLNQWVEAFNEEHQRTYGHHNPADPVEVVNARLTSTGRLMEDWKSESKEETRETYQPDCETEINSFFNGKWHDTPVYKRSALKYKAHFSGPAIIEELSSTTVIPPEHNVKIDSHGNIHIETKI
jgi:N-methylhydantoinase A